MTPKPFEVAELDALKRAIWALRDRLLTEQPRDEEWLRELQDLYNAVNDRLPHEPPR